MSLHLRETPQKYKLSHYIPWNILLCWCLVLWAVLCVANRYQTEQLTGEERAANISECPTEIATDGQSGRNEESVASQRLWEFFAIPQVFFRISEVFLVVCIVLLIVSTQRYVRQELDTVKRLVHTMLKPLASEQATSSTSETYYNATHSDAGTGNDWMKEFWRDYTDSPKRTKEKINPFGDLSDFLFGGENESSAASGDFHFAAGKMISEVHEVHSYEFPSDSEYTPEFCGLKVRRIRMESHTYSEIPCSFEDGFIFKPRFITTSPEFQEFLSNMKEFTTECYGTN